MDIRRLSIFLEVVEQGGFTRAADALLCSQPAVSQAIGQLESELGTPLFLRIGRRVELTAAGRALVAPGGSPQPRGALSWRRKLRTRG